MFLELVGFESSGYRDLGMAVFVEKVNFRRYWSGALCSLTLQHSVVLPMCDRVRISAFGLGANASVGRGGSMIDVSDSDQPEVAKLVEWFKRATMDGPLVSVSPDQGSRRAEAKADCLIYNSIIGPLMVELQLTRDCESVDLWRFWFHILLE